MAEKSTSSTGITFLGLLAILFIGLKLGEVGIVAEWPWIWVLSPLWIGLALVAGIFGIALLGIGGAALGSRIFRRKNVKP